VGESEFSLDEAALIRQAEAWMASDPDASTRAAVRAWLEGRDLAALREHFSTRLDFGTAGLRGLLGPGPARMNRALVRRVARGLADHLVATQRGATQLVVVVGADARHGSADFRADACGVLAAAGLHVVCFEQAVPTPLVAFTAREMAAAAAIVITASHNPPQYNGIKIYGARGQQVVPPQDAAISALIDAAPPAPACEPRSPRIQPAPATWMSAYDAAAARARRKPRLQLDLSVVYTPLHGVGGVALCRLLRQHGVRVEPVSAQFEPDADFPTVRFPNPEEPGALDLALAMAQERRADLVLANDPDADRLAVGVRTAAGLRVLSGNELGAALGEYLLRFDHGLGRPLVATTIVSSRLLSRIAAHYGADYAETLTGFKWIADLAERRRREAGSRFVFGYEEALGYTVDSTVADKDGIGTALLVCEMAAWCKSEGRDLLQFLAEIQAREGVHQSRLQALNLSGPAGERRIREILQGLRERPPSRIGPAAVAALRDYSVGLDGLPPADVLALELAGGGRILVRPSGTEPKIKFYFEVRSAPGAGSEVGALERLASAFLELLP
jgi:phosphomannomutase